MLDEIEMVFGRQKDFNLKLKPKKCHFFLCSVVFLGYVLFAGGISANPEKVEKVQNQPVPSNQKELHSFLGLASYYRCFIPKFAVISKCLHELVGPTHIKKDRKIKAETTENGNFQWADEHQKLFDLLKAHLTSTPVLGYLDFSHPFDLETCLIVRIGAVLSQKDECGQSKAIAYASQSLHPSERNMRNYSLAKLELLVLKWAMTEKLQDYLLGSKFTVYTNNNPLACVREIKLGEVQIRWLSKLLLFDFDIKYRTCKSNKAVDALNCHPSDSEEMDSNPESEEYETIFVAIECEELEGILDGEKIPQESMVAIQDKEDKPA